MEEVAKRSRTMELLESALNTARNILPPMDFAVLFKALKSPAGGAKEPVSKASKEVNALPDIAFAVVLPGGEKDEDGLTAPRDLRKLPHHTADVENPNDNGTLDIPRLRNALARLDQTDFGSDTLKEEARRHLERHASVALPNSEAAQERTKRSDVAKGFIFGGGDGGMHAHGLNREANHTFDDGAHRHMWKLPGTEEMAYTAEDDGNHVHIIGGGESTAVDGEHYHTVIVGNAEATTELGGAHSHEMMIETTGFGALHTHVLKLPDGTEIESISPSEYANRYPGLNGAPMQPASVISSDISRRRNDERMIEELMEQVENQNALIASMMMREFGGEEPLLPNVPMMVDSVEQACTTVEYKDAYGETMVTKTHPKIDAASGDIVQVSADGSVVALSKSIKAIDKASADRFFGCWGEVLKSVDALRFEGPEESPIAFVLPVQKKYGGWDTLDQDVEDYFDAVYIKPLGLTKSQVRVGYVPDDMDNAEANETIKKYVANMKDGNIKVVAVSKKVKEILGEVADFVLPHPKVVKEWGNHGEIDRKLRAINKCIDKSRIIKHTKDALPTQGENNLVDSQNETQVISILKTDEERQIVYGVVLDPYQVDAQNDWIPPSEIEATAHAYVMKSRVIGFEHQDVAEAQLVESFVEAYPTPEDRTAAFANEPHQAYVRKYGDDRIHSGAWIIGVKVGDEEWALVKSGEIDAFSIGGVGEKTSVSAQMMPDVTFISPE